MTISHHHIRTRASAPHDGPEASDQRTPGVRDASRASRQDHALTDMDLHLFNEGTHYRLYSKLGAHVLHSEDAPAVSFAVWAPNAHYVSVIGDFNDWNVHANPLNARAHSGIWEGVVRGIGPGSLYKYHIASRYHGYTVNKADPFATLNEMPPGTASVIHELDYQWNDSEWMQQRRNRNSLHAPISIYEVHLGSWMRVPEEGYRSLHYREMADRLCAYVQRMGFTHVELLPVMEHPFFGSWGYQVTGFFAPSSRYGLPEDFMYLVDRLHQCGIGIILDWVPSHFPTDEHGLIYFDGTHLFEHADPRQGYHPDWHSAVFNYGRNEVRSFLISSAMSWLDRYHIDGLRVDAVSSMLYLDFSRREGEWIPNQYGGRENLDAIAFLRQLNDAVHHEEPDALMIAEEATSWPLVSRPPSVGGLGFNFKWDMGWMHDTLRYMKRDPIYRRYHHNELTFRHMYAFAENFVLPLSHDEVVYGKGSLLNRMPGDQWQQFANLRLLLGYMFTQPGKKLLFMGGEFGQRNEWNHDSSLDWHLLEYEPHAGVQRWVQQLNRVYREQRALHELDCEPSGFEWIEPDDMANSVLTWLRRGRSPDDTVVVACNFTPVPRHNYRVGVPTAGFWEEVLNSDAKEFGGSGQGNMGGVESAPISCHYRPHSLNLTIPPLGVIVLRAPRLSQHAADSASTQRP